MRIRDRLPFFSCKAFASLISKSGDSVRARRPKIEYHSSLGAGFMKSEYTVGTRVRLSVLGKVRCPRLSKKTGTLVGHSIYVNSVVVLFDGNKTSSTIHIAYLEVLKDHSLEMSLD